METRRLQRVRSRSRFAPRGPLKGTAAPWARTPPLGGGECDSGPPSRAPHEEARASCPRSLVAQSRRSTAGRGLPSWSRAGGTPGSALRRASLPRYENPPPKLPVPFGCGNPESRIVDVPAPRVRSRISPCAVIRGGSYSRFTIIILSSPCLRTLHQQHENRQARGANLPGTRATGPRRRVATSGPIPVKRICPSFVTSFSAAVVRTPANEAAT